MSSDSREENPERDWRLLLSYPLLWIYRIVKKYAKRAYPNKKID